EKLLQSVQHRAQAIAALTKAVRSFDEAAIFTIHGFCQQVLQQYAFESGAQYNAELIEDESELTQELIDDYWRRWVADCSGDISKHAILRLMTAKGFNPAKLAKEIGNISRFVDKKIIPETKGKAGREKELETLSVQFKKLQQIWAEDKNEIIAALNYEHLNGRRYNKKSIPGWVEQMDLLLTGDIPPVVLFDKFEKFTQSYLVESVNKAGTPVHHPFFEAAEVYE